MAVGARDALDTRLTHLYANVQTVTFEKSSRVDADKIYAGLTMMAMTNKALVNIHNRKSNI